MLAQVRSAVHVFGNLGRPDRSYAAFLEATRPRLDLACPAHREPLQRWLNAWGCRIRYPRPGEPDHFGGAVASWWARVQDDIANLLDEPLASLTSAHVNALGAAYEDLSRVTVAVTGRRVFRTMGPTAASKSLYALMPRTVMPWDAAIAHGLHGGRDGAAFVRHLESGRHWANQILAESGLEEDELVSELGRPGSSLAKVLDEYCYVHFTLRR